MLPPNEAVILLFSKMLSQWNYSPEGKKLGMNYPALQVVMGFYEVDDKTLLFERLQVCESELLTIINEQN